MDRSFEAGQQIVIKTIKLEMLAELIPCGSRVIGYLGVYYVDWHGTAYMVLVAWPRGNDGQKQLVEECREKWKGSLIMMRNKIEDWPCWEQEPSTVFQKFALSKKTSLTELKNSVSRASRDFVHVAGTVPQKLAAPIRSWSLHGEIFRSALIRYFRHPQ